MKEDKFFSRLATWILAFLAGLVGGVAFVVLRIAGRVRVSGKENLHALPAKNVLLVSNHPSLLEPVLIPFAGFWPKGMVNPFRYLPWQMPDKINYLKKIPLLRFLRCIPVDTTYLGHRKDPWAFRALLRVLSNSTALVFPEGTRSGKTKEAFCYTARGARIGEPSRGVGAVIDNKNSLIVPIFVRGADKVLPIGRKFPCFWVEKIEIIFGAPFFCEHVSSSISRRERRAIYARYIMRRVAALDDELSA